MNPRSALLLVGLAPGCADPAAAAARLSWGRGYGEPLNGHATYLDEEATTLADLFVFVREADWSCGAPGERTVEVGVLPDSHVSLDLLTGRNLDHWEWCWGDSGDDWRIRAVWAATAGRIALAWDGACRYEDEYLVSQGHLAVTLEDVTLVRDGGWAKGGRIQDLALPEVELLVVTGYVD